MPKTRSDINTSTFFITKIHRNQDLRGVQWRMDVLRDYMSRHRVRNNQAHVYINKKEDRARWIVVWRDTPFLIMAPVGSKLEYRVGMTIAADFADTDKLRQEFLNETTNEISELE